MHRPQIYHSALAIFVFAVLSACKSIGPGSVERDRFDYNTAIANSWKEQTLLNIVKLRYADMPLFVEVASVVAGYTLESQVSVSGTFPLNDNSRSDTINAGASGKFTDRPTITYAPITGKRFNQSFLTPIPPEAVLFLMQAGWSPELILPLIVDGMNGLRPAVAADIHQRSGDSAYYRAVELFGRIQRSGGLSMQILVDGEARRTELIVHYEERSQELQNDLSEFGDLLGIAQGSNTLTVSYGMVQRDDRDLALLTRSMLQIMIQMSKSVNVPEEHVESGRTAPAIESDDDASKRMISIQSSGQRPSNAFVAVRYRDYWFWIDDRDFASKKTFAFLMILFSLTETGGREGLPVVTIPSS